MKTIYIPIGSNCFITQYLRTNGLRMEAFPFDWNCSSLKSVYEALNNNFESFLDNIYIGEMTKRFYFEENEKCISDINNLFTHNQFIYPVICKKYSILFPHDYKSIDDKTLESVKEKYKRRIDRFNYYINQDTTTVKVILIYSNIDFILNDWQKSVYNTSGIDVKSLSTNNLIYIDKIKNMYKDKEYISVISFKELKKNTNIKIK